jgi:hypothetical protein
MGPTSDSGSFGNAKTVASSLKIERICSGFPLLSALVSAWTTMVGEQAA